jgi:hypothetical protein
MTSCLHKMCERTYGQTNMKRAITLARINHPWNQYNMHMLRSWPTKIPNMNKMWQLYLYPHSQSGGYTGIPFSVRPSVRILYRFHGWLIFARVIALFMFVWPYVRPHILCMQLVICLLSHFIHIWYLDWPWSEHAHIIPISRMVDFCESYSPFHVCLTIRMVKQTWKGLWLSQKSTICEIGIICTCSDHGQPRYQIWIKSNKTND